MFLGSKVRRVRRSDDRTAICVVDCLDNVGSLTSHNPIGLQGLLRGWLYFIGIVRRAVKTFPEFVDIDVLMHYEFVPPVQIVSGHFCMQVLQRLRDKWQGQWFLHHDNAPSHTRLVQQFLAKKSISVSTQPPYSPVLAPSDFRLFPTQKVGLKRTRSSTMQDMKFNASAELWMNPK
jgi:hypothetical protein